MAVQKIDHKSATEIRSILNRINISVDRLVIDFRSETVESEEYPDIKDPLGKSLLGLGGLISSKRADELKEEVSRSREEW